MPRSQTSGNPFFLKSCCAFLLSIFPTCIHKRKGMANGERALQCFLMPSKCRRTPCLSSAKEPIKQAPCSQVVFLPRSLLALFRCGLHRPKTSYSEAGGIYRHSFAPPQLRTAALRCFPAHAEKARNHRFHPYLTGWAKKPEGDYGGANPHSCSRRHVSNDRGGWVSASGFLQRKGNTVVPVIRHRIKKPRVPGGCFLSQAKRLARREAMNPAENKATGPKRELCFFLPLPSTALLLQARHRRETLAAT